MYVCVCVCQWANREHEEGVEHQRHSWEGLQSGHHVPLQTQREYDEQRHYNQQQHAKIAGHLYTTEWQNNTLA